MTLLIDCTNASKSSLFIAQATWFSIGEISRRLLCVASVTNSVACPTTPSSKYLKDFGLVDFTHEILRINLAALYGPTDLTWAYGTTVGALEIFQ